MVAKAGASSTRLDPVIPCQAASPQSAERKAVAINEWMSALFFCRENNKGGEEREERKKLNRFALLLIDRRTCGVKPRAN
jgi:hypothetical protein